MKTIAIAIVVMRLAVLAFGQNAAYRIADGHISSEGWPTTSARICVNSGKDEQCYSPPAKEPLAPFGLNATAKELKIATGAVLIAFTAESWMGGSGSLISIALLENRNGQLLNLLPTVFVTDQSEYSFWNLPLISMMPVLVSADFVFDEGETHFSPHHYRITSYVYHKQSGRYVKQDEFITAKKYEGLDDTDKINVLGPEKATIVHRLQDPEKYSQAPRE